ncbi:MAG: RNA methyltransferase [Planctomycetes bacterium]|nr:RNA methyltransferase [Planctomycetota bacterium]
MASRPVIRSIKNPLVQRAREVLAGRDKRTIALEGERLVDDARRAGLELELVLVAEDRAELAERLERVGLALERVDGETLARVSQLSTSPGVLALAAAPRARELGELDASKQTVLLAVAGVAEPGNLGALARSAEASGASGLLVVAGGASPWNQKALRGSMGSLLRLPVFVVADASSAAHALAQRGFRGVAAATRGGVDYREFDWRGPLVLWVGSETGELPPGLGELAAVSIPMAGSVESLNVAVATSLLLFEAARARRA